MGRLLSLALLMLLSSDGVSASAPLPLPHQKKLITAMHCIRIDSSATFYIVTTALSKRRHCHSLMKSFINNPPPLLLFCLRLLLLILTEVLAIDMLDLVLHIPTLWSIFVMHSIAALLMAWEEISSE